MEKQLSVNINTMLYVIDWWGWGTRGLGAGNARRGTRNTIAVQDIRSNMGQNISRCLSLSTEI